MQEFAGQSSGSGSNQNSGKEGAAGLQTLSGVQHLETGDILIRTAGIITLVTPSGDRIVIDAEGKLSIEGKVVGADRNKEGVNSICFKDNAIIKVDKHGLLEIHRNGHVLKFPREVEASNSAAPTVEAEPVAKAVAKEVEPVKSQPAQQAAASESKPVVKAQGVERKGSPQPSVRSAEPASKNQAAPASESKKWAMPSYELPGLDISL